MKKVILVALCIIANTLMVSCSNDEETTPNNKQTTIVADGSDPATAPPTKPPRP